MIKIIVAMSQNHVIGNSGDLPWSYPEDLKHFKKMTMDSEVLMGRKTFDSIHKHTKGRLLPGRKMTIVSRKMTDGEQADGTFAINDMYKYLRKYHKNPDKHIWIIGGGEIYDQTINLADELHITVIKKDFDGDTRFPHIVHHNWIITDYVVGEDPDLLFITFKRGLANTVPSYESDMVNLLGRAILEAVNTSWCMYDNNIKIKHFNDMVRRFENGFALYSKGRATNIAVHDILTLYYDIEARGSTYTFIKIISNIIEVVQRQIERIKASMANERAIYSRLNHSCDKTLEDRIQTEALLCQSTMRLGC